MNSHFVLIYNLNLYSDLIIRKLKLHLLLNF